MIKIEDLTGIPEWKRKQAIECLDDLLTFKDSEGNLSPIITGYNWYNQVPELDRIVTFSHIHETKVYRQAMISDLEKLGYSREQVETNIREKGGTFLWEVDFQVKGENGEPYPELIIKNVKTGKNLDLSKYKGETLEGYPELEGKLLGGDCGWELDLPFENKIKLMNLINLFVKKSYKCNRSSWPEAYETPVLLLGKKAIEWQNELPNFVKATKIELSQGKNELSFIINQNLTMLKIMPHYNKLMKLGFSENDCLGNKSFIREYINKKRKI